MTKKLLILISFFLILSISWGQTNDSSKSELTFGTVLKNNNRTIYFQIGKDTILIKKYPKKTITRTTKSRMDYNPDKQTKHSYSFEKYEIQQNPTIENYGEIRYKIEFSVNKRGKNSCLSTTYVALFKNNQLQSIAKKSRHKYYNTIQCK